MNGTVWLRWRPRLPWLIVILALTLRLGYAGSQGLSRPIEPGSDEAEYDAYAWNVAQGHGYRGMSPDVSDQDHLTAYRSPGPSLVYAVVYRAVGHRVVAVRLLNCLIGALCCLLIIAVGRRCFGDGTSVVAATVWAVWPVSIYLSGTLLSDQLATATLLCLVLSALQFADRPAVHRAMLAGLIHGITLLVHPSRVFLLPMLAIWAAVQFRGQWKALRLVLLVPVVAALILAPWAIRNTR